MARWERFAVRALGALETELTVLGRTQIGPRYLRVEVGDICALPAIRFLLGALSELGEPGVVGGSTEHSEPIPPVAADGRVPADDEPSDDEPAVEVWLERCHAEEAELPVPIGAGQVLHRVHRTGAGTGVAEVLEQRWALRPPGAADRVWIALESSDTRRLTRLLRGQTQVRRESICATACWKQS